MILYLAGTKDIIPYIEDKNISILESFYYVNNEFAEKIKYFKNFLLDSGAFTFLNTKKEIDWNIYLEKYVDFINKYDIKNFFELDIDNIIGYDKVKLLRKKLIKLTNKQPIPVFHRSRGKEEFLNLCSEFDYIAIGGIAIKHIKKEEYKYFKWFIDEAHKKGCKIHGLGYTDIKGLKKYDFDSVDSTTWLTGGVRFGYIHKFNNGTIKKIHKKNNKLINVEEANLNNFTEWVKFQKYAERWL